MNNISIVSWPKIGVKQATVIALLIGFVLFGAYGIVRAQSYTPISGQLKMGDTGASVSALQRFLASDPKIYPEGLVTGYYGPLTARAVSQFQIGYGLPPVGNVGPFTLAMANGLINSGLPIDVTMPAILSSSVVTTNTSATVSWSTNETAKGKVYYSTAPLILNEPDQAKAEVTMLGGNVIGDATYSTTKSVVISGLNRNTLYYFMIESVDAQGNVSVTVPGTFQTQP